MTSSDKHVNQSVILHKNYIRWWF